MIHFNRSPWMSLSVTLVFQASLTLVHNALADEEPLMVLYQGACVDEAGDPVAGAVVTLHLSEFLAQRRDEVQTVETNMMGEFEFDEVPFFDHVSGKVYLLTVTSAGCASVIKHLHRTFEGADLTIALEPAFALRGKVTANGKPIEGVSIYTKLLPPPFGELCSAKSNAKGEFEIDDLPKSGPPDIPFLRAIAPGYGTKLVPYPEVPGEVAIELEPAAIVEGRVIDKKTGKPIVDVVVQAQGQKAFGFDQVKTDAEGRYRFDTLVEDRYNIWANVPDLAVAALDGFQTTNGATSEAPDLLASPGGLIVGRVVHEKTKLPIAFEIEDWADIAFYGPSRPRSGAGCGMAAIEKDGSFQIRVPAGTTHPYFRGDKWLAGFSATGEVEVREGEKVTIEFHARRKKAGEP